jgi:hydroxyacylglutathione hydrolase
MKITKHIHALKHFFKIPMGNGMTIERFVYSYIIFGDYITLIDTGVKGSFNQIYDYIGSEKRDIKEIDKIILSHSHPDHMGSAQQIKQDTECIVLAHEAELNWFENLEIQFNSRPVPGFFSLVDQSVEIDILLEDGDIISPSGAEEMKIIHTPGHSPGSISILFSKSDTLFTGDSIPVENDIPSYDSYVRMKESLEALKDIHCKRILTSWTDPIKSTREKDALFKKAFSYLGKIDSGVKKYYTVEDDFTLSNCQKFVEALNLPVFFINPIVDKALRTHLK